MAGGRGGPRRGYEESESNKAELPGRGGPVWEQERVERKASLRRKADSVRRQELRRPGLE